MTHPWEKWGPRPTPELVSRLNDLTSLILCEIDEDDMQSIKANGPRSLCRKVEEYASEAHWISEELEHRIRKTEYAGLLDIEIVKI